MYKDNYQHFLNARLKPNRFEEDTVRESLKNILHSLMLDEIPDKDLEDRRTLIYEAIGQFYVGLTPENNENYFRENLGRAIFALS